MTRQRLTVIACGAAVLSAVSGASVRAQITSRLGPAPCVDAPRLLVITPSAPTLRERQAAEKELRSRITANISTKELCVIPKEESDAILSASGWRIDTTLSVVDAVSLARTQLRADEILLTEVSESGGNFEYSGQLILVQDRHSQWLRDSVPKVGGEPRLSTAAQLFAKGYKELRKQLPHEKVCYEQAREGKFAEAAAAARLGIAAFPEAVISRMCLAEGLQGQKKTDEYLAVVDEILRRDPDNVRALLLAMFGYHDKADTNRFADVAGRIVALDPTNPEVENIIGTLAQWRRADIAMPMIRQVLRNDPENRTLLEIEFRLLYAAGNWTQATARGEALAPIDTAFVDTIFIQRMYTAYANDSQPTRVLEWLTRGTRKFPNVLSLAFGRAQQLKRLGQTQAAIEEYKRVLALQPKAPTVRLYIASYYDELAQTDSAIAWLRRAAESGDDTVQAGGVAYLIAMKQFGAAQAMGRDSTQKDAAIEEYKRIIPLLAFSDSLNADVKPKLYWGVAAFHVGNDLITKIGAIKPPARPTCEMVKEARVWIDIANEKIAQGGRADQTVAGQLFPIIQGQVFPWFDQVNKQLKCTP